jgi:hypothetical protein
VEVIEARELEHLVRETFPQKRLFSAERELGIKPSSRPAIAFVHGGCDPLLERQFEDWLDGSAAFVAMYQLLNRLCRAGALKPGDYAIRRRES